MKTKVVAVIMVLALFQIAFAGGILTNTNQSVQFVRMLARNASTQIDAVYFNPAGMTQLSDGFFLAFYSQTISKTRTITNSLAILNTNEYKGDIFVPVFPNFYAVYKKGKFAAAFGFEPIAGGGTADFKKGLPEFEMNFAMLPTLLTAMGVPTTAYSVDLAFKGSSVYYGFQTGIAYALTDQFSASVGVRYNMAKNTYEGSITNVMVNPNLPALGLDGSMIPASTLFTALGDANTAAALADQEVDAELTGNGITPIFGLNFKVNDKINMGLKYEMKTKMELETKTTKDLTAGPMFPDGEKERFDIPAILSGGVSFQVTEPLMVSAGGNYYFDKNADNADMAEGIDSNTWEAQVGLEYAVDEKLSISAGYQRTQFDLKKGYYSGLSYDLNANTIGGGVEYLLSDNIALEFGGLYAMYEKKEFKEDLVAYEKSTWLIAAGLQYTIKK